MLSAAFAGRVHVLRLSRASGPARDAVRPSSHEGHLLLNKRSQDLIEIDGRSSHFVTPPGSILLLQEKAFLDGVIVIDIPARRFGFFPFRIRPWTTIPFGDGILIRESFPQLRTHVRCPQSD